VSNDNNNHNQQAVSMLSTKQPYDNEIGDGDGEYVTTIAAKHVITSSVSPPPPPLPQVVTETNKHNILGGAIFGLEAAGVSDEGTMLAAPARPVFLREGIPPANSPAS
jgi:hypothetical protein